MCSLRTRAYQQLFVRPVMARLRSRSRSFLSRSRRREEEDERYVRLDERTDVARHDYYDRRNRVCLRRREDIDRSGGKVDRGVGRHDLHQMHQQEAWQCKGRRDQVVGPKTDPSAVGTGIVGVESGLAVELLRMLATEAHHIMEATRDKPSDAIGYVKWCPRYVQPQGGEPAPGGRQDLHHRCRRCSRLCLHLLGKPGMGNRFCLACAGYSNIPSWYFHDSATCAACRR
eukprot:TRINITY_DN57349_c0_g1_i1.p1 TRINITY_DN57349_c0_g1~~TRINITY_DN57349_c0_g1_i1.p1  ORF type:complete len:229 (+),score=9.91 TRINITY_DN57349_c0_g1_i1:83-769(+)